jgi:hypothetical protein
MCVVQSDARYAERDPVLGVIPTGRPLCRAWFCAGVVGASGRHPRTAARAAEQAHAVDAASRPQDPSFFEGQNRLERLPDLSVAAQLMGKPLGGTLPVAIPLRLCHNSEIDRYVGALDCTGAVSCDTPAGMPPC